MRKRLTWAGAALLLFGAGVAVGHSIPGEDRRLLEECQDTLAEYVAASLQ